MLIYPPMNEAVCPHCRNVIHDEDALLCHFCGNSLCRASGGVLGALRSPAMKGLWIVLGLLMIAAFVLTMM